MEHKKRAVFLFWLAVIILVLAVWFVYQPIGNEIVGWLATAVFGQVTEGCRAAVAVYRIGKEQLMDSMEMRTLQETGRVVEKMADFAGSVILQLLRSR